MRGTAPRVLRSFSLLVFVNALVLEFLHFPAINAISHVIADVGDVIAIRTSAVPAEEMIFIDWFI